MSYDNIMHRAYSLVGNFVLVYDLLACNFCVTQIPFIIQWFSMLCVRFIVTVIELSTWRALMIVYMFCNFPTRSLVISRGSVLK